MGDLTISLIETVKEAAAFQQALAIQGAGTKAFLGVNCNNSTQSLCLAEHTGIIEYEPVELVMTARAGTSLREIDEALAANQQILACDPARFGGDATIGGSLAANQSGPARPWVGSLRDHVLGVKLINGKGDLLNFGGRVMKNVAGYDVSRLQAGAMGTLGIMTEISFKVLPEYATSVTISQAMEQVEAIQLMNQLAAQAKPLNGAFWYHDTVYLRLSGAKSAVYGTVEKWQGEVVGQDTAASIWRGLRDQHHAFFTDRQDSEPLWKFSVNSAAPAFLTDASWLIDWAGSQRWLKGDFCAEELQQWASDNGGEVILYQGGKTSQEVHRQNNPIIRKLQKNLKQSFDPYNILNPGRLYEWL